MVKKILEKSVLAPDFILAPFSQFTTSDHTHQWGLLSGLVSNTTQNLYEGYKEFAEV